MTNGANRLTKTMTPSTHAATSPTLFCASASPVARKEPSVEARRRTGQFRGFELAVMTAISLLLALDTHARIDPAVQEIGFVDGEGDRRDDDEEDALHDRVVALADGRSQNIANALVDEDRLDEYRPAHHEADGDRQLGYQRQDRVATHVGRRDPAIPESPSSSDGHVVLVERRDGADLHQEHPGSHVGDDVGDDRQDRVVQGVDEEGEVQTDLNPGRIRSS